MTEVSGSSGDSPAQPAGQPAPQPPVAPKAAPAAAPTAGPTPQPPAQATPQDETKAPSKPKIKTRMPYQRSCNEKDAKGKLCAGHLKRWYGFGDDIKKQYGENVEIYRCEYCHTLYLPAPGYESRSGTLQF